jgi:osmotically-inducible protein OsmY
MTRQKFFGFIGAVALATGMTTACAQSDAGITSAVKAKFVADDIVKSNDINVDTKDRVVTLKGDVQSAIARERAIELARTTDGVRDVVDALAVAPATAPTSGRAGENEPARSGETALGDAGITGVIKTKMLADTTVGGLKIDVDTKDGIVTLTGNVNSAAEKRKAIEIARESDGVKSVTDRLKIVK